MQKSWFFNNGQKYGQEELRKYFTHIYRNGVSLDESGAMELQVSVSGSQVTVSPGFAIIGGFAYENDMPIQEAVTPDPNYERIDRMVLRLDITAMEILVQRKKGVAASSPQPPQLQRDGVVYELSLAQVKVSASGNLSVVDERADQDLCGAIRPRNLAELETMLKEYQRRFEEWFNAQQAKGWRNIYIQENDPEGAVDGSLWM